MDVAYFLIHGNPYEKIEAIIALTLIFLMGTSEVLLAEESDPLAIVAVKATHNEESKDITSEVMEFDGGALILLSLLFLLFFFLRREEEDEKY